MSDIRLYEYYIIGKNGNLYLQKQYKQLKPPKISDLKAQKIKEMINNGIRRADICRIMNISKHLIKKFASDNNLSIRTYYCQDWTSPNRAGAIISSQG
jgi:DNA invertase Pin-like site-specific DNA recombinase